MRFASFLAHEAKTCCTEYLYKIAVLISWPHSKTFNKHTTNSLNGIFWYYTVEQKTNKTRAKDVLSNINGTQAPQNHPPPHPGETECCCPLLQHAVCSKRIPSISEMCGWRTTSACGHRSARNLEIRGLTRTARPKNARMRTNADH